jgi:hypothetical protein
MNILQDILGLITKGKVKPPTDKDYMVVASYTDAQEILKPQPKMQANLVSLAALKNYILSSIAPPTPPAYKVYTAIITGWENDAPSVIELENTIGTITFVKVEESVGRYKLISDFLFTEYKTVLFYGSIGREDTYVPNPQLISNWDSAGSINLYTFSDGVESSLVIWKTPIEIRVYN